MSIITWMIERVNFKLGSLVMKTSVKLSAAVLAAGILAGCAGPNQRVDNENLFCAIAGGLAGGAVTAMAVEGGSGVVGGAAVGAVAGLILCPHEEAVAAPVEVVTQCPEPAPAGALKDENGCAFDTDGDGVVDGIDMCANTPAGVAVDRVGCPLDSDKDAVPDYLDLCPSTPLGTIVDTDGCPLSGQNLLSLTGVNFDYNKAVLTSSAKDILEQAVTLLKETDATIEVRVEGHTDSRGTDQYNMVLSQKRAEAVVAYLIAQGVSANRLVAVGMGEGYPVASNETEAGRAANRRVDFVVK
jgi:OOP family OmpA-OmpF porin